MEPEVGGPPTGCRFSGHRRKGVFTILGCRQVSRLRRQLGLFYSKMQTF